MSEVHLSMQIPSWQRMLWGQLESVAQVLGTRTHSTWREKKTINPPFFQTIFTFQLTSALPVKDCGHWQAFLWDLMAQLALMPQASTSLQGSLHWLRTQSWVGLQLESTRQAAGKKIMKK